jgi:serine protease
MTGGTNLLYNSGPIYSLPQVAVVYWGFAGSGNDPNGEATYFTNFVSGMGGTWWSSTLTQYQNPSITMYSVVNPVSYLVGTWNDTTNAVPATPTSSDIAAEAQRAVTHFGFWANWNQINYVIATPTGHSTSDFAANGGPYCAWHSTTPYNGGATFPYTNFPYQSDAGSLCGQNSVNAGSAGTLDGVSIVGGHEIAETVTDPQPTSGWADSSGQEIGDKCAWTGLANLSTTKGTFAVQPLWSNAITNCTQSYQSSAPTKTCTNDAYGYCLQIVTTNTNGVPCDATGGRTTLTRTKQYLWNNGVYAGTYALYHVPSSCPDGDEWDPTDPVTQKTDPLLP